MCVGFLYTLVLIVQSSLLVRKVSRKGRLPSFSSSMVNWIVGRKLYTHRRLLGASTTMHAHCQPAAARASTPIRRLVVLLPSAFFVYIVYTLMKAAAWWPKRQLLYNSVSWNAG